VIFYRYLPADPADLAAGGVLETMALDGELDTAGWTEGMSAQAGWVVVDNPDWAPGELTTWLQAQAKGAARISRGEGAWYGNGVVYVVASNGGPARQGQVFAYDPASSTFTCVFASPSADVLNATGGAARILGLVYEAVAGSVAVASWEHRPITLIGAGSPRPVAGTSKTKPWRTSAVHLGGLLAGQPAALRGGAARAVADRAAQAGEVLDEPAGVRVEGECRRTTGGERVAGRGAVRERRGVAELVVADQSDAVAVAERAHASCAPGVGRPSVMVSRASRSSGT
jgi:hypothetical protein